MWQRRVRWDRSSVSSANESPPGHGLPSGIHVSSSPLGLSLIAEQADLGNLSTGGTLGLGRVKEATLQSEPGFMPAFRATVLYGEDYVTGDPNEPITRPDLTGTVYPDDGSTPFQMHSGGIQVADAELAAIVATNTSEGRKIPYGAVYSVWTPTFRGGDKAYSNLQKSIFVGSETVSDSGTPGEFLVGIRISKVSPVKTNITIGEEFP
ncbi:hypothetical protein LTR85_010236 [Meristemomyces frigidus]|nr:hypothetical protein LTR85_010236 [Meristemomyces frigidus]